VGRLAVKNVTERKGLLHYRRKIAGRDTDIRVPAVDSPEWKAKGLKTRENQGRYLQLIATVHGHRTVAGVRPVSLFKMRGAADRMTGGKIMSITTDRARRINDA
jgi:hypothetical protein